MTFTVVFHDGHTAEIQNQLDAEDAAKQAFEDRWHNWDDYDNDALRTPGEEYVCAVIDHDKSVSWHVISFDYTAPEFSSWEEYCPPENFPDLASHLEEIDA